MVKTTVTHSPAARVPLLCFYVICDLLLNRRTATWNLFVKYFHGCTHLHVSLAFGLVVLLQTKVCLAISLFILLSVN